MNDRRQSGAAQDQNSLKNAAHHEEQVGLKYRRRRRRRRDARRRRLRVLVDGGRVLTCKTKRCTLINGLPPKYLCVFVAALVSLPLASA